MAEFRIVTPDDEQLLAELFTNLDNTFFRPHPFTAKEAARIARQAGRDTYAVLIEDGRAVAYGMLRGWDEGYAVPSLGIAVRTGAQRRGLGRLMMANLHAEAAARSATVVRLRVHPRNVAARRLYEAFGYAYAGDERGELVMLLDLTGTTVPAAAIHPEPRALEGRLLEADDAAWPAVLEVARHDFYHLPAYLSLSAEQQLGQARALYVTDGRRSLLLPLVIRPIPAGGSDATSPYGYPGPVGRGTEDPDFLRVALVAGLQVLHHAGIVSAFVRFHPILNPVLPTGIGTLVRHGETVSIDLTVSNEELWARTRTNHRRDITRALRLGYAAKMDGEWRHFEAFKRLYWETMRRRSADSFYFFDDAYFDRLRDALADRIHLCVIEKDRSVAAAGLFVETHGIVQYHLSGTGDEFRVAQPTKLMMHFVSAWAKERGNVVMHLGGGVGGDSDSLLQFKIGFSPLRHTFATLRMVIDENAYTRLVAASDPSLDPEIRNGFFPLYRKT